MAYAARSIDGAFPKYKLPKGFPKSRVLFNLHRIKQYHKTVVLVEGFFDCMKVSQAGFFNVAGLMGSSLAEYQQKLLVSRFRAVVLMLDGDPAGHNATSKILHTSHPSSLSEL